MNSDARKLRLRVTRRDDPDRGNLIEWVLSIADARHFACFNREPAPYGLRMPDGIELESSDHHGGPGKLPGQSAAWERPVVRSP